MRRRRCCFEGRKRESARLRQRRREHGVGPSWCDGVRSATA